LPHPSSNLSSSPQLQGVGHQLIKLKTVDSTNNYAMASVHAGLASHGTIYYAESQTAGKGQREKGWVSEPGKNITLSIVLEPLFLQIPQQFQLSAAIAVACHDFLCSKVKTEFTIKWPNDLYWNDRKAGGILIENVIQGGRWKYAIAGIGINVNQERFPEGLSHAVSLRQITGTSYPVDELIHELAGRVEARISELRNGDFGTLQRYNELLFGRDQWVRLKKGNIAFETKVKEVNASGQLITEDSLQRSFDFGEVTLVL
jgi:BirA family biotin operon repressor/biotin-[acetyl-CoA-carboxylase] ligase